MVVEQEVVADKEPTVDAAQVSAAATTVIIDDITLAKALKALKTLKPKIRGIFIIDHEEPSESRTTTTISSKKSQDKGKSNMIEEPVKLKNKDQILFDEEVTRNLQEGINEEEILVGERARQEEEANIALIKTWEDIQAKENQEKGHSSTSAYVPIESIVDEAINKEIDDRLVRAATTTSSLEVKQDSSNIAKTQSKATPNELSKEMVVEQTVVADKEPTVNAAQVSAAATIVIIDDITLAKAIKALKTSKPKIRGIFIIDHEEPSESRTTTTISSKKSQDKGKSNMIEEPVKLKNKDQILFDEEVTRNLQEGINKEEILIGERARQEEEANIALIKT
nr:hypothetical protein [Tanacetum cinerariifolium]